MFKTKRLQKELQKIHTHLPAGIALVSAPDFVEWQVDIQVLDESNPIYKDQIFRLRMRFTDSYPIEPPDCQFLASADPPRPVPLHPHIYSNGVICLDLLSSSGWSPVHNAESIAMSLQSMLTGNTKAERPQGDDEFVRRVGSGRINTRGLGFVYEDDTV